MEESNINKDDPIKRFVEKDDDSEELSPFNPPDAYSTSSVEPVAYEDMAPVLQKLMDEHKKFLGVLGRFENSLIEWKKNNWTISDDMNSSFKEFFQFVDNNTPVHNAKEEKAVFPLLHKRLIESGEHGVGENPRTAIDIMEDEHIKVAQACALVFNFMGLGSRLPDPQSREITFDAAFNQGMGIVETMKIHLHKEDEVLFPLAMKFISNDEFEEMQLHAEKITNKS